MWTENNPIHDAYCASIHSTSKSTHALVPQPPLHIIITRGIYTRNEATYDQHWIPHAHPSTPPSFPHTTTMADDTRKPTTPSSASPDEAPSVAAVVREARAPANVMPGGTAHTAGGERVDANGPSYVDVVRSLPADYYLTFYKRPCVRDSQLTGIGAGFVGGSIAAVMRSMWNPIQEVGAATALPEEMVSMAQATAWPRPSLHLSSNISTSTTSRSKANNRHRTRFNMLELGSRHLVRRILHPLPNMPILPQPRKGRHAPSPRPHGEETRHHRGEKRSPAEIPRGTNAFGGGATARRGTEEELGVLGQ